MYKKTVKSLQIIHFYKERVSSLGSGIYLQIRNTNEILYREISFLVFRDVKVALARIFCRMCISKYTLLYVKQALSTIIR